MKNKRKCGIMKAAALICGVLLGASLSFGVVNIASAEEIRTEQESNTSYMISAVSDENSVGVSVGYVKDSSNVELEFDLLKEVQNGYFGVVYGQENNLSKLSADYVGTSYNGGAYHSQNMTKPMFTFKSGYRYRVELDKKDSTLEIYRKPYAAYETLSYERIYQSSVSASSADAIGFFARSQGENSATVYLDNFSAVLSDGTKISENFDKRVGNIKTVYSNISCFSELSSGARYTVIFTDLNGNAIKVVDTSEYGYAMCEAPEVEGKTFKGWNINPKCVTSNMVLYPIYGDSEESGQTQSEGCNSVIIGGAALLPIAIGLLIIKRRDA